jgi:hypothetical protein
MVACPCASTRSPGQLGEAERVRLETNVALRVDRVTEIAVDVDVGVEAPSDAGPGAGKRLERRDRDSARAEHRVRALQVRELDGE